jgi:hypothetical protein
MKKLRGCPEKGIGHISQTVLLFGQLIEMFELKIFIKQKIMKVNL